MHFAANDIDSTLHLLSVFWTNGDGRKPLTLYCLNGSSNVGIKYVIPPRIRADQVCGVEVTNWCYLRDKIILNQFRNKKWYFHPRKVKGRIPLSSNTFFKGQEHWTLKSLVILQRKNQRVTYPERWMDVPKYSLMEFSISVCKLHI